MVKDIGSSCRHTLEMVTFGIWVNILQVQEKTEEIESSCAVIYTMKEDSSAKQIPICVIKPSDYPGRMNFSCLITTHPPPTFIQLVDVVCQ